LRRDGKEGEGERGFYNFDKKKFLIIYFFIVIPGLKNKFFAKNDQVDNKKTKSLEWP